MPASLAKDFNKKLARPVGDRGLAGEADIRRHKDAEPNDALDPIEISERLTKGRKTVDGAQSGGLGRVFWGNDRGNWALCHNFAPNHGNLTADIGKATSDANGHVSGDWARWIGQIDP